MQKKYVILIGLLLTLVSLSACGVPSTTQATPPPLRTLNVSGSGKVFIAPDIAYISIGVHTEGENATDAVAKNSEQAKEISDAIKGMGIDLKDIQTTNFNISPQQKYDDKGQLIGIIYMVDNSVYVTIRDLTKIGALLDVVTKAGANNVYGIQFDLADKTSAISEARKLAVENARTQAQELAQAAGVMLGAVQTINTYNSYPVADYVGKGGGAMAASDVPISPGQLSLTVEVNMVYEIK
jgi:uncharacterized protein YggE